MGSQLVDEGVEDVHRVELGLVGEHDAAERGERHVEVVDPPHPEAHRPCRIELAARGRDLARRGRVGDGVAGLHGDVVVVAEAQQPLLALEVGAHVGLGDLERLDMEHPRQLGALQERQLAGGVAGGHRPDVSRLDDGHAATRSGQQQGCGESGQACSHDEIVDPFVVEGVADLLRGAVEPQGS